MSSIYNGRSSISKNLCSKSTHKSIKTQLIEHRIEWKAIIITLIEMSGRKRKQLTLGSWKGFKKLVQHCGEKVEVTNYEYNLSLTYKVPI